MQLLISGVEVFVFVGRLIFDAEMIFVKDISETAATGLRERLLKDKGFPSGGFAGATRHLDAHQTADIKEVGLSDLDLVEDGVRPFADEFLRCHAGRLRHNAVIQHLVEYDDEAAQLLFHFAADAVLDQRFAD